MPKSESEHPIAWFDKAEKDLITAKMALASGHALTDVTCYHAQQCGEKFLKGYLKFRNVPFKWSHDLGYLIDLCSASDPEFSVLRATAANLTQAAVASRYPGDEDEATDAEARQAVENAERIREMVLRKASV